MHSITGNIESIAFGGNGILKDNGLVIFIPFTAPQDQVTAVLTAKKKNYAQATLLSINVPGPNRIDPVCPYFTTCGGCQFQHLNYPAQLEVKRRFIADALSRIAKIPISIPPIIPAPHQYQYRCHITLNMKPHLEGFQAGYISWDNNRLIPISQCPIFCAQQDPILSHVQQLVSELDNKDVEKANVRLFKSQDKYLLAFQFSQHPPSNIAICQDMLATHPNIQAILINSVNGTRTFGTPICNTESLGIFASFSPYGFLQNFPEQRDAIYRSILAELPEHAVKVLDLYCGIGITSLLFAKQGKTVIGIESNDASIAMAQQNAARNQIHNVTFYNKKVEEKTAALLDSFKPDSVLCNPPREGLDPSLIEAFAARRVPYIQYLSCMPATLARDLKSFTALGYTIEKIQGFDMFPQTTHVETLVLLRY
jgi:23S rRNA (uracil1939-C5)-methyltransferase